MQASQVWLNMSPDDRMKFARGEGFQPDQESTKKTFEQMMMKHYENQSGEGPSTAEQMEEQMPTPLGASLKRSPRRNRIVSPHQLGIAMDFGLTSEQQLLQSTLRDFSKRELEPHYMNRDRDADLPPELVRKLGELGVLASMVDPRFGGSGLDYVSLGIAHEEIARGDFNAAYVLLIAALVGAISRATATRQQQAAFLPAICRGDFIPALAVTEPAAAPMRRTSRCRRGATATPTFSMAKKPPSRLPAPPRPRW